MSLLPKAYQVHADMYLQIDTNVCIVLEYTHCVCMCVYVIKSSITNGFSLWNWQNVHYIKGTRSYICRQTLQNCKLKADYIFKLIVTNIVLFSVYTHISF